MTLDPDEFIRRFLLHTLPDGFHRIRHYGFLANGHRAEKLALCRSLLSVPEPAADHDDAAPTDGATPSRRSGCCPGCGSTPVTRTLLPRLQPFRPSLWYATPRQARTIDPLDLQLRAPHPPAGPDS